ncbi:MAG TPA: AtpZ/AtpI family protein [Thermoanaerobaculia bacterium]|jgi:F0F1-type ATP synthase assembly protein I|nr:AtpZ/AtpI family protein [Thermoanaerobaculia bacterium]
MAEEPQQRGNWTKLSGIGIELAAAVAGFTLAGYWWDRHFHTGPWGLLIGLALGLVGGTYNLIRQSLNASREAASGDKRQ